MARNWGVKSVPAGGWNIAGTTKLDRVSHTSKFHSWEPQDINQVLCNKKALQYVTEKNDGNSLSGLQLSSEGQAWTGSKAELSGDLPIPAKPNTNVKQIQHVSKPMENSRISCSPKKIVIFFFLTRGRNMKVSKIYYVIFKILSYAVWALVKPLLDKGNWGMQII